MPYTWEFNTGGLPPGPLGKKCHRGPMIDIEIVMSKPFTIVPGAEALRGRLLAHIVDTSFIAVRTREVVLRVLNSNLGPMYVTLNNDRNVLLVDICEKRNSVPIDHELRAWDKDYVDVARRFKDFEITPQSIDLLLSALNSVNPVFRLAARCAIILMAAYIEQRSG
ncbi:MAG: hypothetical protein DRP01_00285 [Archaeoglobales archaeon]|nr:MAG: hypothetical protein DRP01_00285 [Archaeoglobales archaeon]